jgi:hypothetical protein
MPAMTEALTDRSFEYRIRRFEDAQRFRRQWISLAEIAEWCGCLTGEKEGVRERRQRLTREALQDLLADIQAEKLSNLLFLSIDAREPVRLTGAFFRARLKTYESDPDTVVSAYLIRCWVPLRDARTWFQNRAIPAPQWLSGTGPIDRRRATPYGKQRIGRPKGTAFNDNEALAHVRQLILYQRISSVREAAGIACSALDTPGASLNSAVERVRKKYAALYGNE